MRFLSHLKLTTRLPDNHVSLKRQLTLNALQFIAAELKRRKWREADLAKRAKSDSAKVALAGRLRAETTVTVAWMAERLSMGVASYLNNRLYRWRKGVL